jgi:hypothetical protein
MIRMTVAALLIIGDHYVRAVLTHDWNELTYNFLYPGLGEGIWRCVGLPALHTRVMITQRVKMRHTEDSRSLLQLCMTYLREALTVGRSLAWLETQAWVFNITKVSVGTGHKYGRVTLLCSEA